MSDKALRIIKDPPSSQQLWESRGGAGQPDHSTGSSARPSTISQMEQSVFGVPRWYSTLNFVFGESGPTEEVGGPGGMPSLWVDNLSSDEQEQLLIQELLYVLCGSEGTLITIHPAPPRGINFLVNVFTLLK